MGSSPSFPVVSLPRERIVIVTGGNTGLGYQIAKWLAMMGATVIIACRSEDRAKEAIKKMNSEYEEHKKEWQGKHELTDYESLAVEFLPLDLASFKSTLEFVEAFKTSGRQLHILICNAGIGMVPFEKTEDGYEKMLQVNYLSHFIITAKLLPIMRMSGNDCRILFMSSDAHRTSTFDLNTMNYEGNPSRFGRLDYYGRSKIYQIMQTSCMTRRLKGTNICINCSHPGTVATEMPRNFQDMLFWRTIYPTAAKIFGQMKTPLEGATSVINAAVNPELAGVSGMYYKDCKDGYKTSVAKNEEKQEALWSHTIELLKEYISEDELKCLEGKDIT